MFLKSSPDRWVELPAPDDANEYLPGLALASLIRSATLDTGRSLFTISTLLMDAVYATGRRSRSAL
ncbi:hypothetical protein D3C72_1643040 [compost metagenome]